MYCLIVLGVSAVGLTQAPAQIAGPYYSSCGTSYCREARVNHPDQVPSSKILGHATGYGYSSAYNYGLQPDGTRGSWSTGSSSYNYGSGPRLK